MTSLREAVLGAIAPLAGLRMVARHPTLWLLAFVPSVVGWTWSMLALLQSVSGLLEGGFFGLLDWVGFVFETSFALMIVSMQVVIALLSPLLDLLSERTERILGEPPPRLEAGLVERTVGALQEAARLLVFKLVLSAIAYAVTWVPVVGPAVAVFLIGLVLALDFLDYPLARRLLPLEEKRRWLLRHPAAAVAFSLTCYVLLLVPGLGGLFLAPSVVGGTWLVCQVGPPEPAAPRSRSSAHARSDPLRLAGVLGMQETV